jgi:hypothetical protein
MDDKARLQLQNMIQANNVEDQTNLIRELKHSTIFRKEIQSLLNIKEQYKNEPDQINFEAMLECNFLFTYYTDLYNKIRKDELDLQILDKFINVLERIENGEMDQHEGSFLVGTILKELYIDSALKKAEKLDEQNSSSEETFVEPENISWKQFKYSK